jgi:hypothetical protein
MEFPCRICRQHNCVTQLFMSTLALSVLFINRFRYYHQYCMNDWVTRASVRSRNVQRDGSLESHVYCRLCAVNITVPCVAASLPGDTGGRPLPHIHNCGTASQFCSLIINIPRSVKSMVIADNWITGVTGQGYMDVTPDLGSFNPVSIKKNSMVWVRERTIPTERPPLVGEVLANFCG